MLCYDVLFVVDYVYIVVFFNSNNYWLVLLFEVVVICDFYVWSLNVVYS